MWARWWHLYVHWSYWHAGWPEGGTHMPIGFIFWLIMLLSIVFWLGGYWGPYANNPGITRFNSVWLFILLFILGWAVFGFAIQGPGIR